MINIHTIIRKTFDKICCNYIFTKRSYCISKFKCFILFTLFCLNCYLVITPDHMFAKDVPEVKEILEKKIDEKENIEENDNGKPSMKSFNIVGFPVILYQPETSLMFGGGSAVTIRKKNERANARPDNINVFAIYTLKNQIALNINPDFYLNEENWELRVLMSYQKYPDTFFGIGNSNSEDDAEDFTTEDIMIQPWLIHRVYKNLRIGMLYDFKKTNVLEIEENGLLSEQKLRGINGSLLSGFGPVLDWDTRNNIFYPSKGSWFQFYCAFYRNWLGSDFEYESYTLDFRHYFCLPNSHILAVQLFGASLNGEITFNEFARLANLRGINGSRFRDRKMVFAQIEYRYPIYKRFSGVVFSAIGDVMNNVKDYDIRDLKYSVGLGLRFALNPDERINLRFDVGISRYGINPYFQLSEAF